jgi:hypothetical protein
MSLGPSAERWLPELDEESATGLNPGCVGEEETAASAELDAP